LKAKHLATFFDVKYFTIYLLKKQTETHACIVFESTSTILIAKYRFIEFKIQILKKVIALQR